MEAQNQSKKENLNIGDNYRRVIVMYLDLVIRGLISFLFVGIGLWIILGGFLKMKFIYMLPVAFICSILISPFLSRVQLGERAVSWYEGWLRRTLKLK